MERAIEQSLRALSQLAASPLVERLGLGPQVERLVARGASLGLRGANQVAKHAAPMIKLLQPDRMRGDVGSQPELFDLTPTESQVLVRDTMARFARERMRGAAQAADEACAPPAGFFEECEALGLTQLAVPEALGGGGETRSVVTNTIIAEELARGDMGLALAALAPLAVVHALVEWGTAPQQSQYLPRFVGDKFVPAALALLEPRPLFDPERPVARASLQNGAFVLNGQKSLVPLATDAEILLIVAELAGKPQAFVVERGTPGLSVTPEPSMGLRAAKLGRVKLEDVRIPRESRLGGDAGIDAERLTDLARIAWGALAVGTARAVLEYVKAYALERVAFGEPIAHRQSVAFMIADMAIELDAMRLMVYRAASRAEHGLTFRREASLARIQCADKCMQIGTNGVQILGGHGFVKDHPVELWYRHLRGVGVFEGTLLV